jgi:phage protein D
MSEEFSHNPKILVTVEDHELGQEVTDMVVDCEVELSRDVADQITLTILNPWKNNDPAGGELLYTDSTLFQPGNEISVYLGYGTELSPVCRGVITRYLPKFPEGEVPKLTIKALDASCRMMDLTEGATEAAVYSDMAYVDVVRQVLTKYNIVEGDLEGGPAGEKQLVKKAGMSDYQFVKGLANLLGFEFKVRYDFDLGAWKAYWRTPVSEQTKQYTLRWPDPLFAFEPEYGLRDSVSGVKVLYWDKDTKVWEEIKVEDTASGESPKYKGSTKDMEQEIKEAAKFRISAGGIFVEIIANRKFKSAAEAVQYAERWFQARKDNFILARGKTIGIETMKVGDEHIVDGVGKLLGGLWEFTSVNHKFDGSGFFTNFVAHKVLR